MGLVLPMCTPLLLLCTDVRSARLRSPSTWSPVMHTPPTSMVSLVTLPPWSPPSLLTPTVLSCLLSPLMLLRHVRLTSPLLLRQEERSVKLRSLITSDGGWNCRTLLGIQRVINDSPVFQLSLARASVGECKSVFPPVLLHGEGGLALERLGVVQLVHPVLEVLAGVGAARLLSCLCALDDLVGVDHTVLQFQCLNKVAVPDHALVSELEVVHVLPQGVHLLDTLPHDRAITEDGSVVLHGLPDGGGVDVALLEPQLVNVGHARLSSVVGD